MWCNTLWNCYVGPYLQIRHLGLQRIIKSMTSIQTFLPFFDFVTFNKATTQSPVTQEPALKQKTIEWVPQAGRSLTASRAYTEHEAATFNGNSFGIKIGWKTSPLIRFSLSLMQNILFVCCSRFQSQFGANFMSREWSEHRIMIEQFSNENSTVYSALHLPLRPLFHKPSNDCPATLFSREGKNEWKKKSGKIPNNWISKEHKSLYGT